MVTSRATETNTKEGRSIFRVFSSDFVLWLVLNNICSAAVRFLLKTKITYLLPETEIKIEKNVKQFKTKAKKICQLKHDSLSITCQKCKVDHAAT